MFKISIIVPVYNVEKYLHKCLDSILAQTFKEFEVILVDDGSSDNSGKICDEYAKKDSRVKVFHKENAGVSSARNLGLKEASGEWIVFIDSDDYISKDFLECDYSTTADVIQKSYDIINEDSGLSTLHKVTNKIIEDKEEFYRFYVRKRTNALWDKIIRRELIKNITFNENVKIGEDFLFFLEIIKNIKQYLFDDKGIYHYIIHSNSAMQSTLKEPLLFIRITIDSINNICSILNKNEDKKLRDSIIYQSCINILYNYRLSFSDSEKQILSAYYKKLSLSQVPYTSFSTKMKLMIKKLLVCLCD